MVANRLWYNDGAAGTVGATPTVTDTGSGFPVSAISVGASNTITYQSILGAKGIRFVQASANQCYVSVSSTDVDNTEWTANKNWFCIEMPIRISAAPAVSTTILRGFSDAAYVTQIFSVLITTARRIQIIDTVGGGNVASPSTAGETITVNTDYMLRVEWNSTAATMVANLYPLGSVDLWTTTGTLATTAASVGSFRYGITTASANFTLSTRMRLSSGGYLSRWDITNIAPVASFGVNVTDIEPYSDVTLEVNGTDQDGNTTIESYNVYQKSGPTVTIVGTGSFRGYKAPGPTASGGATLVFGATCTDDQGATSAETTVSHTILQVDRMMWNAAGTLVDLERVPY